MNKRDRITKLSANAQVAKSLSECQHWMNEMLLEIAKGTKYEMDVSDAFDVYNKKVVDINSGVPYAN
ncbi:hypothetical protein LIS83_29345 (plasmid) [Bacillus anthracis]|uniref:hypothetical protein n=1 Tax=Bacillus anthracis TaxID=1392 RepID=UPI00207A7000|nr:hypothetical protein [Bacillus anthracis]USL05520.1 hypothetical protein LIS83_29345 [Bacillus anthracis]